MDNPMPKFQALFKAQSALTRIELRAKAAQTVYMCVALVFGFLAFGMLNLAAYLALSDLLGPVWSGVATAGADLVLAIILVKIAQGVQPGPELDAARTVRDLALDSIHAEADRINSQVRAVRDDLKSVTSGISKVGSIIPGVAGVVGVLKGALKKKK